MGEDIICENCSAVIPFDSPKCLYCGAMNLLASEKKYMAQLNDIREDVEELHTAQQKEYKTEIKKSVTLVRKTILIFGILLLLFAAGGFLIHTLLDKLVGYKLTEKDMKEQLIWEKEAFPKLDAWYEEGNYDAILEFQTENCNDTKLSIYNWEHYQFISKYQWYVFFLEDYQASSENPGDTERVEWCIRSAVHLLEENTYLVYSQEEMEQIMQYQNECLDKLQELFGITRQDMEQLLEQNYVESSGSKYLDYKGTDKFAKQFAKEFAKMNGSK